MTRKVIYECVGVKVGCTNDLERRTLQNQMLYGFDIEVKVLETVDADDREAGDREIYWARRLGYRTTNHYAQSADAYRAMCKAGGKSSLARPTHNTFVQDTCPKCGFTGQRLILARWHFDRCRKPRSAEHVA